MNADTPMSASTASSDVPEPSGSGPVEAVANEARRGFPGGFSVVDLVTALVVTGALVWAYWPNLEALRLAWEQPDYTHGYIVLPIALWILWKRWSEAESVEISPWLPGWGLVVVSLLARAFFHEGGQNWLESFTMMGVIVGLVSARLGLQAIRVIWPALAFLCFLYPLPPQINTSLSQPLQTIATKLSCAFLKLTGLWVLPEGNVIHVGDSKLEVAAACNGLSMLMSLAATVAAAAALIPMSIWKRGALLISIIPIALLSNVLRISATAWCYHKFGEEMGKQYVHDFAGYLMMPTALVLIMLELKIISWVVIEDDEPVGPISRKGDPLGMGLLGRGPQPEVRP